MKYELKCKITDKDYIELNEFNILHTKELKKAYNKEHFLIPVLTVILCIAFLYIGYNNSQTAWLGSIIYAVIGVLWLILYRKLFRYKLKRQLKMAQKANRKLFSPESVAQFFDNRIVKIGGEQKYEIGYSAVKRIAVLADRIMYIFTDTQNTVVVQLSVFDNVEEKNEFFDFIESKTVKIEYFEKI